MGQVEDSDHESFPELGIAGPDVLTLVADGTLAMAQVYSGYIAGELPTAIEIVTLWGVYPDNEITYKSQVSLLEELENLVLDETGGVVINHNWFSGVEQYFFCKDRIDTLEDFKGKKTRSHSAALSDWINGMGAAAQFVAFAEVYTALERGILDCGVTGADPAYGQRWYEVTKYMNGPLAQLHRHQQHPQLSRVGKDARRPAKDLLGGRGQIRTRTAQADRYSKRGRDREEPPGGPGIGPLLGRDPRPDTGGNHDPRPSRMDQALEGPRSSLHRPVQRTSRRMGGTKNRTRRFDKRGAHNQAL